MFRVKIPETVYEIDDINLRIGKLVQGFLQVHFQYMGRGHDIYSNFITQFLNMVGKVYGLVNVFCVGRDPIHTDYRFFTGNYGLMFCAPHINHDRYLGITLISHFSEVFFITKTPGTMIAFGELALVRSVAQLDIVYASICKSFKNIAYQCFVEFPIVHQSTIANGAINNFYLWSIHCWSFPLL